MAMYKTDTGSITELDFDAAAELLSRTHPKYDDHFKRRVIELVEQVTPLAALYNPPLYFPPEKDTP